MRLMKIAKRLTKPQLAILALAGVLSISAGVLTAVGALGWGMVSLALLNVLLLLVVTRLSLRVSALSRAAGTGVETRLDRVDARIETSHRRLLGAVESERHDAAVRHRELLAALKTSTETR